MTLSEKNIIKSYAVLFDGLSHKIKLKLIENLFSSLNEQKVEKEKKFFESFGAFASEKSPEELIREIKSSRSSRKKDINL